MKKRKDKQEVQLVSDSKKQKDEHYTAQTSANDMKHLDREKIKAGIKKGKSNGSIKGKIAHRLNSRTIIFAKTEERIIAMREELRRIGTNPTR